MWFGAAVLDSVHIKHFYRLQKVLLNSGAVVQTMACGSNPALFFFFLNKVVLEHKPPPFMPIVPMVTFSPECIVEQLLQRLYGPQSPKYLLSGRLQRSLPTPCVDHREQEKVFKLGIISDCIYGLRGLLGWWWWVGQVGGETHLQ